MYIWFQFDFLTQRNSKLQLFEFLLCKESKSAPYIQSSAITHYLRQEKNLKWVFNIQFVLMIEELSFHPYVLPQLKRNELKGKHVVCQETWIKSRDSYRGHQQIVQKIISTMADLLRVMTQNAYHMATDNFQSPIKGIDSCYLQAFDCTHRI